MGCVVMRRVMGGGECPVGTDCTTDQWCDVAVQRSAVAIGGVLPARPLRTCTGSSRPVYR